MRYMEKVKILLKSKEALKKEFRKEMGFFIKDYAKIISGFANGLEDILYAYDEEEDKLKVVSNISPTLLIKRIEDLDNDFEIKEQALYARYRHLNLKYKKLTTVEKKEQLELALADVKNSINIAVSSASSIAKTLLPTAKQIGLHGKYLARIEYFSDLTLSRQIEIFEELISRL